MAAATIRITLDISSFNAAVSRLRSRAYVAIPRAVNRTASSARTAVTKDVAADMQLRQRDVRDRIRIEPAHRNRFAAALMASARRIPLILFGARGPEPSRGRGRGVSVRTASRRLPHAFIGVMRGGPWAGQRAVLQRAPGAGRTPIFQKFGPSVVRAFEKHQGTAERRAREVLEKNMAHEFRFALSETKE